MSTASAVSRDLVGSRKLLMAAETYHVPPDVLSSISSKFRFELEDMVAPASLECCRPPVSFTLRFHSRRSNNALISLEVCRLRSEAPGVLVVCVCTGEPRPFVRPSPRSDHPATPLVVAFAENECRPTYRVVWTKQMWVRVEVYASDTATGMRSVGLDLDLARRQGVLTDVVLKVNGEDFPAHRAVLAARSHVFHGMFRSAFKEAVDGVVSIDGVSVALFRKFLAYVYRGELQQEGDWQGCEVDLLELADLYMVDTLKAECERRLMEVGGVPGVVSLLQTVSQRASISSSVRTHAVEMAIANWGQVSTTHEWADFEGKNPILADFIRGGHQARRRSSL